jgi:hypothetical protein
MIITHTEGTGDAPCTRAVNSRLRLYDCHILRTPHDCPVENGTNDNRRFAIEGVVPVEMLGGSVTG